VRNLIIIAIVSSASLEAQEKNWLRPFPSVGPRSIPAGVVPEPLSPGEKAKLAVGSTFGLPAIGNRLVAAGWDQIRNHPEEWGGGMEGFGTRFGSRMGRRAVRNSIRLGTDIAFGLDPRYDRCNCTGFRARTGHAWKRVFVSRTDSGSETFAVSNFTGAYVTPMIVYQWYPDRLNTWNRKLESGTVNLGWRGLNNMLREFWPELRRNIPIIRNRR